MNPGWAVFWERNGAEFWTRLGEHVGLTAMGVGLAVAVGVPLGMLLRRRPVARRVVMATANVMQTIPALALLALLLLATKQIGALPTVAAMAVYGVLPVMRNTLNGFHGVDPEIVEASRAMGMRVSQTLWLVEIPLALPSILTGVRTATSWSVGTATLGAFIGAGGLGVFIYRGLSMGNNLPLLLAGTVPAALLAVGLDALLAGIEKRLQPWKTAR